MLDLPPPYAFGFPEYFQAWRQDQLRGIELIIGPREGTRATGLTMPTGSGKSLVNVAGAVLYPGAAGSALLGGSPRTAILTSTKALEDQYYNAFNSMDLVNIRGMGNYPCLQPFDLAEPIQCDEGPCRYGNHCGKRDGGCLYYDAVKGALGSPMVVTNYSYWLSSYNYGQGLGNFDMLIMDEAHETPDELGKFLSVTITERDCQIIGSKGPEGSDTGVWGAWAKTWYQNVANRLERHPSSHTRSERNHHRALRRVLSVLDKLKRVNALDWVADAARSGEITFDVVDPSQYKELLFRGIPRLVLTSATLRSKTLSLLGLAPNETESWECPSRFPLERRPIIHYAGGIIPVRVDARMSDGMKRVWVGNIDQIIEQYLHHKGIIHTVSYDRALEIYKLSKWKEFMILNTKGGNTMATVAEFRKRSGPAILVSPSVMTGWDFPADDCRWQIIAKVPMPDSRVPVMKARQERDPDYGPYLAMRSLVQASGRGMRSADDWCVTFLVDDHAAWFVKKYRHMAPNWFHRAFRTVTQLPPTIEF